MKYKVWIDVDTQNENGNYRPARASECIAEFHHKEDADKFIESLIKTAKWQEMVIKGTHQAPYHTGCASEPLQMRHFGERTTMDNA